MLINILASLGLLFVLKYGYIFKFIRTFLSNKSNLLKELFKCSMCLGFHCGWMMFLFSNIMETHTISLLMIFNSFKFGFMISLLGNVSDYLIELLDNEVFTKLKLSHPKEKEFHKK